MPPKKTADSSHEKKKKSNKKPANPDVVTEFTHDEPVVAVDPHDEPVITLSISAPEEPEHTVAPLVPTAPTAKKRGRKPKGGKIISESEMNQMNENLDTNVILHLKCSKKDLEITDPKLITNLEYNPVIENVEAFNESNMNTYFVKVSSSVDEPESFFQEIAPAQVPMFSNVVSEKGSSSHGTSTGGGGGEKAVDNEKVELKDVWQKINTLEHNLHMNHVTDKKSACFWCTCDFDTPPIYLPKHYIHESYSVYGCFCTPECAVSYLMEETIDSSTKFERYQLMNHIYGKLYNYKKNIKPAPSPYYLLDKFYGNLSIQEYRKLLKTERLLIVVDKPLKRIMPELYEDNDEFLINNNVMPSNMFQMKKKNVSKVSKSALLKDNFGLASG